MKTFMGSQNSECAVSSASCTCCTVLCGFTGACLYKRRPYHALKVILVPFITFAGVSVFRKCVNAKRPYTIYGTTPIVAKDKTGESMPSRHTASFTVIAMTWLYVNPAAGVIMLVLAFLMGVVSVLGGVHFVKDVLAGAGIGVLIGIIGLFLI